MFTTKIRVSALLMLTVIVLAAWGKLIPRGAHGNAEPAPERPKVPKELLGKRFAEAKLIWEMQYQLFTRGDRRAMQLRELFGWSERLLEAELALTDKKEERRKAHLAHLDRTRNLEGIAITLVKLRAGRETDAHVASYDRLSAEIRYFEATGQAPPPPPEAKKDNKP